MLPGFESLYVAKGQGGNATGTGAPKLHKRRNQGAQSGSMSAPGSGRGFHSPGEDSNYGIGRNTGGDIKYGHYKGKYHITGPSGKFNYNPKGSAYEKALARHRAGLGTANDYDLINRVAGKKNANSRRETERMMHKLNPRLNKPPAKRKPEPKPKPRKPAKPQKPEPGIDEYV